MPPSIEVIIYDLGNVILPFNHYQIAEKLSRCAQRKGFQDPQELFFYLFDLRNISDRFDPDIFSLLRMVRIRHFNYQLRMLFVTLSLCKIIYNS